MKTCEYAGESLGEPRSHPWTDAVTNPACRYYDFKVEPQRIRTSLEDFLPWSHYPAVTLLYELLERLNSPASRLESNDCAFSAPHHSEAPQLSKLLQCDGRVMILFRKLGLNLSLDRVEELKGECSPSQPCGTRSRLRVGHDWHDHSLGSLRGFTRLR